MSWKYTGDHVATFSAYLNKGTGETLVAEPGEVYDIAPASGTEYTVPAEEKGGEPVTKRLPVPPDGSWERVKAPSPSPSSSSTSGSAADKE